ncbi:MAG TPA: YceI family protein [Puia sp.]|jgi:polyisoprenoid-binding protein YceI
MKGSIWLFCFFLISRISFAQLHPVEKESKISFTIKNFGFNVTGSFSAPSGEIRFDPDNPADARFDVSVSAASINTDNNLRDGHLRGEDYLDTKNYPRIRFVSVRVQPARKKGSYQMTGNLTIRDKTKEISFPFTADPSGTGYLFAGDFKINRKEFGVGGSSTVSDNLTVELKVLARQ